MIRTTTPSASPRTHPPAVGSDRALGVALGSATVLMGLIAGFFYAYACSVMIGLARVDDRTFVEAMQAINATVRNAAFAPSFFGALLVTGVAAALAYRSRSAGRHWILAALVLYAGAFLLTMGISVPLNESLAAAGPVDAIRDLDAVRAAYEDSWVRWNVIRTVLSAAALASLVGALLAHRRTVRGIAPP